MVEDNLDQLLTKLDDLPGSWIELSAFILSWIPYIDGPTSMVPLYFKNKRAQKRQEDLLKEFARLIQDLEIRIDSPVKFDQIQCLTYKVLEGVAHESSQEKLDAFATFLGNAAKNIETGDRSADGLEFMLSKLAQLTNIELRALAAILDAAEKWQARLDEMNPDDGRPGLKFLKCLAREDIQMVFNMPQQEPVDGEFWMFASCLLFKMKPEDSSYITETLKSLALKGFLSSVNGQGEPSELAFLNLLRNLEDFKYYITPISYEIQYIALTRATRTSETRAAL
ncbi:MAG TPA: hypothetical protein VGL56_02425 [Fimbriimonadaceae bacterium]|jgi:hypothetical protein